MNNYCVYEHVNKINNKRYIGQTCQAPETRWGKYGIRYKNQKVFFDAILEFGWDNFEHNILIENLTKEEANEKEKYYIKLFNTTNPNNGYNVHEGRSNKYGNIT